jgi:hypothetical protein
MSHMATDKRCECLRRLLSSLGNVKLTCENDAVQAGFETRVKNEKLLQLGLEPRTLGLLDPRSNQLSYKSCSCQLAKDMCVVG